jgi:hypothetical protein
VGGSGSLPPSALPALSGFLGRAQPNSLFRPYFFGRIFSVVFFRPYFLDRIFSVPFFGSPFSGDPVPVPHRGQGRGSRGKAQPRQPPPTTEQRRRAALHTLAVRWEGSRTLSSHNFWGRGGRGNLLPGSPPGRASKPAPTTRALPDPLQRAHQLFWGANWEGPSGNPRPAHPAPPGDNFIICYLGPKVKTQIHFFTNQINLGEGDQTGQPRQPPQGWGGGGGFAASGQRGQLRAGLTSGHFLPPIPTGAVAVSALDSPFTSPFWPPRGRPPGAAPARGVTPGGQFNSTKAGGRCQGFWGPEVSFLPTFFQAPWPGQVPHRGRKRESSQEPA